MRVYLVFHNIFKLLNDLIGPKTRALSRPYSKLAIWRLELPFRRYLTEIGNFFSRFLKLDIISGYMQKIRMLAQF